MILIRKIILIIMDRQNCEYFKEYYEFNII